MKPQRLKILISGAIFMALSFKMGVWFAGFGFGYEKWVSDFVSFGGFLFS